MRLAETVTFGGSGLDRAAALRGNPGRMAALLAEPSSRVLAIWRGKPLLDLTTRAPCWLPFDHPVFGAASEAEVFLGIDNNSAWFARDVSGWRPDASIDTVGAFIDSSEQIHPAVDNAAFCELRAHMVALGLRDAELVSSAKAVLGWHWKHGYCACCGAKSEVAQAGWQRDCAACGAHHFPRTDPVVIMLILYGNSVLVGRSHGWPEGMYSLLAGFVEPGETIEAAVRRETFEETAIVVGEVGYLASQPWPFPSSLMFGCIGHALSADVTVEANEIEDALWVSREDMMEVVSGNNQKMKAARKGSIARFLIENWLADTLD